MESAASIATDYPAVTVEAQVADFADDFELPGSPRKSPRGLSWQHDRQLHRRAKG